MGKYDSSLSDIMKNQGVLNKSGSEYIEVLRKQASQTVLATVKTVAYNTALSLAISAAVALATWVGGKLYDALTISTEEMENCAVAAQRVQDSMDMNDEYVSRLKELDSMLSNTSLTLEEQNSIHEEMLSIQDDIIEKYGQEAAAIDLVNDGIRNGIKLLQDKKYGLGGEFETWLVQNDDVNKAGDSNISAAIDKYSTFQHRIGGMSAIFQYGDLLDELTEEQKKLLDPVFLVSENLLNQAEDREALVLRFDVDADEAQKKILDFARVIKELNFDGKYDELYSAISEMSQEASNVASGNEKTTALFYYKGIVQYEEELRGFYNQVEDARAKLDELLSEGDPDRINRQYGILSSSIQTFLANIRNSSIIGADETAAYFQKTYAQVLDGYKNQNIKIQLTANDSELTSKTVAALQGLAQAGYVTAGQIKSAFDGVGEEGAAQFEQITGAVELTEEEIQKFEEQLHSASDQFNELTNGNVDYHSRPVVSAEKMWAAGWKEVAALEQATVYTQGHDIVDAQGIPYSIEITPILENGEVLSEDALLEYIESAFNGKFNGVDDLLRLDDQKLIVHVEQGTYEDNSDVFGQLNDDLISVKESHLEAYNALNGYMTAAEGFKHIEKLAEDMGKTFAETVDYLSDMGYFGAEFSNSVVSNKAQDIIANFSGVMDVLNKARREQETLGYVTVETVQEIQGLSSTYDDISDVIEYNGEQYIFAADQANTFAEAQRKAGEKSLVEVGAIKEDILALNSYYRNLGLTATRVKEYSEEAYELQEIQKKVAEGTGFTATELKTLEEKYGELPAMLDETTGLFYLEATAIETLTTRFSELIEKIIEFEQKASEEFGLQTLATQLGADINSYKVQKTYEGIMNRIQKFGIKSTEEYLKNAPDAVKYKDILDNYFATQDELALWQGIYNKEYDVPEPTDSPVNKDKSDPWKESFEKEYQAKKHALAMEQIDQKAYLDWLDGAYKKYFSDMSKYQDEYNQYEEEVFNGRRALIDEHISDLEKEYEFFGDESKVIEELNRLLEEKKGLLSDDQRDSINSMILEYQENGIRKQIDAIEDQVELLEDREGAEDQIIECYKREINLLYDLKSVYGQIYDAGSDRMLALDREIAELMSSIDDIKREQWEAQRDAQVDALEEEQDAIEEYQDAIEDILDATVDYIKRQKEAEIEALEDARDARDEWYDNEIDRIEEVADQRKEALDDELEGYRKIIEAKKEALRDEAETEDYNDEVAKRSKEISDLQTRIDKLSLDDSKSAAAERMKLEEELATKKKELAYIGSIKIHLIAGTPLEHYTLQHRTERCSGAIVKEE